MPLGHGAFPIPLVHREQPLDDSGSSRYRHARILAQEPAQSLIAPHRSRRHDRVRARNRSPQIEPSMWSCLVVVLNPFSQNALQMPTIEDQKPIETFPPGRADWRSMCEFALGAAMGVVITAIPSPPNTRSEPPPYLES